MNTVPAAYLIRPGILQQQEQHPSGWLRFQADTVIDRILQSLLTAKVTLSRLDGHVPKQELYLFELPARMMTPAGASPAEVVRSNRAKSAIRSCLSHDRLDDLRGKAATPHLAGLGHRTEEGATHQVC